MKWEKLGQIILPKTSLFWNRTHAMLPTPDCIEGDIYRVYFSGRNDQNISHIGAVTINLNEPGKILDITQQPILSPGELGCFDDNGVSPSCIVNLPDRKLLYYIGWKPRCTTRMSIVAGLAESVDGGETFHRVSRAPILRRSDKEPFSIMTAPSVIKEDAIFRMWYVSGIGWTHADLPRYNIKCAESKDGIVWDQQARVAINFRDDQESALARPCVIREGNTYKMWYSYKNSGGSYAIGYAESPDGFSWERMDHKAGIEKSLSGWDSEMIEYGSVFTFKQQKFMLYNGNNYGANGAGLAVLRE
ncbi:MAG: hypothetical protein ACKVIK_13820 [Rhodospirillales bacterium]|jgi:hypothetical protein